MPDSMIIAAVEKLWAQYDVDGNGYLDKTETKRFVADTFKNLSASDQLSEEQFEEAFNEFDQDKSGKIDKGEMVNYMKKAAGLAA